MRRGGVHVLSVHRLHALPHCSLSVRWLANCGGVGSLICRVPATLLFAADPLYADVTWGAGGSTSDLTLDMCVKMKTEYGLTPNMHLTW